MNIKKTDLVLEVGSGNNPNPRSDILCDLFVTNNSQRAGKFSIVIDRPFITANGYNLPFKNKTFDYIICSHLLEHLERPLDFAKELTRVGKAGYIEVPNIYGERLFGWDFHLWYCEFKNNYLVLTRKKEGERFGGFFHRLIARNIWFRRFFEKDENIFYIKYEWKGKPNIKINEKNFNQEHINEIDENLWKLLSKIKRNKTEDLFFYFNWMRRRVKSKLLKVYKKYTWSLKQKLKEKEIINYLSELVVCPKCKSKLVLKRTENFLKCMECNKKYLIESAIPILLMDNKKTYE